MRTNRIHTISKKLALPGPAQNIQDPCTGLEGKENAVCQVVSAIRMAKGIRY